jgi:hypothetical protein
MLNFCATLRCMNGLVSSKRCGIYMLILFLALFSALVALKP